MAKTYFKIFSILFLTSTISSCNLFYSIPTKEDIKTLSYNEMGYDSLYFVSEGRADHNSLLKGTNYDTNVYCVTFTTYGVIDGAETLYIHGYDDLSMFFDPIKCDYPMKHSYQEVIDVINRIIPEKTVSKEYTDDMEIVTSTYDLDRFFGEKEKPDNYFAFCYLDHHYVYEVDGELQYTVI